MMHSQKYIYICPSDYPSVSVMTGAEIRHWQQSKSQGHSNSEDIGHTPGKAIKATVSIKLKLS